MSQFYSFIVFWGICQTVQAAIHPGCENCGCCVDRNCSTSSGRLSDYCNKGCIDGIYGDRCYNKCPSECAACERNGRHIDRVWTHYCTKCPDGKYLSKNIRDCSLYCPATCKTCSSNTVCADCKFPYFNYGAVTNCSLYCPGNCECSDSGTCLTCTDGYFSPQSNCRSNCPSTCQSCSSLQTCDKCQTGFYNGREFDTPNGTYYRDCRYSCRTSCVDCLSYNLCYSCVPGTYGIYCDQTCSVGCKNGTCDKSNGNCECKPRFIGQQCSKCVSGKYGKHCDKECSSFCKNNVCEKSDGQCVECVSDYFTDKHCSRCISGRYGSNCSLECPKNCNNSICKRYSGECSHGCNENYAGDKCDACVSGKYGENCSLECPRNCHDNACVRETGFCFACKGNLKGDNCDKCKTGFYKDECSELCKSNWCLDNVCHREFGNCTACPNGYYGELCDKTCSYGCKNETCDIESGACSVGCLSNFSGDKCCVQNSNCETCKSNSECLQCKSGYYGVDCEMKCPLTCNGNCDKRSGRCETCPSDMYGLFCNYSCPISCSYEYSQRMCNASSGHCLIGCQNGNCSLECPKNCNNSICKRYSGECSHGCNENYAGDKCDACVSGKYGENCSLECPRNCHDNACFRETGFCFACKGNLKGDNCDKCKTGFYKDECSELCKSNWCLDNVCHREFGNCTACPNGYYGELCDKTCSYGCRNETCDIETGACSAGCLSNFSGDKCCVQNSNCETCKSNSECLQCKSGYYGVDCEMKCPLTCNGNCDKRSGRCETCPSDMYGLFCNYSCPISCSYEYSQRMCNASSVHCLIGCQNGNCSLECPKNCNNSICKRYSGECSHGCNENYAGDKCDACVSGKYGENCSLECPRNCHDNACFRETGFCFACKGNLKGDNCDKCKTGFYKDECSELCKSNWCLDNVCHREFGNCTACPNGYYGELCDKTCSYGCRNETCDIETGACSAGCLSNFSGDKCCVQNSNCETCKSNSECLQCKSGYYGVDCEMKCPLTCNGNCDKRSGRCETCPSDMYGLFCNYSCPISCSYEYSQRMCNASSGHCLIGCQNGNCSLECPKNCNNSICKRYSGECSHGCNENYAGDKCDACVSGKYGENCSLECPRNCHDNACFRETGFCFACKGNLKGDNCDKCKTGFYKDECSELCKSNWCLDNVCHREFGNCTACPNGYYGELCDKTCSYGCRNETCDIETGACSAGCLSNFSGDKCCVQNSNCETCKSNSECLQCKSGYYGVDCEMECLLTCNGNCDKRSGRCETCPSDMYGLFCNYSCPISCSYEYSQRICNASSGHCLIGCQNGYHGHTCEDKCSHNCVENKCHRSTGYCEIGCAEGFQGRVCSEEIAAVNMAGPFAGGVIGLVMLVAGSIVGICFFRKRKKKVSKSNKNNNMDVSESVCNGETSDQNSVIFIELQKEDNDVDEDTEDTAQDDTYYNMTTKIKVSNLFNYVRNKTRESFKTEFTQLPKNLLKPCTFAKRQENKQKNRYNGMYPYDHSRVQINGDPTFFINACYIDGFQKEKEYIASLGPTKKTTDNFNTFWKMVWHAQSDVIVMLTNLTEPTGMKCEQYWPCVEESIQYDGVTAVCEKEEVFVEYTVRTITLSKDTHERTLIQFHYTAWPDKDVPDNVTSLIEFWQRVKMFPKKKEGPTIVHCSAGVGRTGTYIALDRLAGEGESTGSVDVYDCVMSMREQRVNMVQTLEQYIYLHKALCHSLTFDCHPVPAETFIGYAGAMTAEELDSRYQEIRQSLDEVSNDEQQTITTNKSLTDKNRKDADIPGDRYRPRIYLNRSYNDSDYINATNIDSFTKKNHFIMTQTPLPTTVQDFLCLIYQEDCPCLVSLETVSDSSMDIGQYLPCDTQSIKVDSFTVSCIKSETRKQYTLKTLLIHNEGKQMPGEKTIYHYQYTKWKTGKSVPSSAEDFVQFVKDVETKSNSNNSENRSTVLVHCLNGATRSGLFCAVAVLLERLQMEYQVSIANTVRQIRWKRKTAIPNKEQFEFCHRCVSAHLELYNTYSNFDA